MSDTEKRGAVMQEFYAQAAATGLPYEYCHTLVVDSMTDEIVRLRDILATLRKPSAAMVTAVCIATDWQDFDAVSDVIHAAVTAVEQEVGRE